MRPRAPAWRRPDERQTSTAQVDHAQSGQAPPSGAVSPEAFGRLVQSVELIREHLRIISGIATRREMAVIMADRRFEDPLRLERSGFRVHSQYDEDGIIAEIFRRIGTQSKTFVEFGVGPGVENCSGFLLMQGWRGLWIEYNADFFAHIERMWASEIRLGLLSVRKAMVTPDTIDEILTSAGFSGEIDFLSVDIDANDYHVLEKISVVAPRVICVEYNANIPPEIPWKMARNDGLWDGVDDRVGASLKAFEILLSGRGYALVGCAIGGANAFFVRKDLAEGKFAAPYTAENHYHPWRPFYLGPAQEAYWRGWRS
jgi:hypothetical protein